VHQRIYRKTVDGVEVLSLTIPEKNEEITSADLETLIEISIEKLKLKDLSKYNLPRKKFAEIFKESNEDQDEGYIDDKDESE